MSQDSAAQHWSYSAAMADFPEDCLGVSAQLSFTLVPLPQVQLNFSVPQSREHQDQRERDGVKDFQSPGWYAVLRYWQIKIMNWGRYQCIILHFLTHGSRCVVSAWIPVSNYISASAHWCHSFPVITQSPACQGQVTSRWAWLVLNWALSPILSHCETTISHQASRHNTSAYGLSVRSLKVMVNI